MTRAIRSVIKAGDARLATRGMYSLDLRDIEHEAAQVLAAARAQAERIIAEARAAAHAQSELTRQTAHREGYAQGQARGQETGHAAALEEARARFAEEHAALGRALTEALAAFAARREQLYAEARRDVVLLGATIASRVWSRLAADESVVTQVALGAMGEALEMVGRATQAMVRVNPADAAALERFAASVQGVAEESSHIRIVADESVARGGVRIETADSVVDATIAQRLDRVADELVSGWRERLAALGLDTDSADKRAG
ncbi:MAG: hypothetical protein HRU71_10135 [Planctomycetia bacterium]|nr:MAG: hypothetical protein HRU71_10135 [Planctomycetia bacterium]